MGSYVEIVVPVEERELWPETFRYHFVPAGSPDSVYGTSNVTSENVTDSDTGPPFTVNPPEKGEGEYCLSPVAIEYEYDPLGSGRVIELAVDEYEDPDVMFTNHLVDEGRPDSVNVIAYVTSLNVIVSVTAAPLTVKVPDATDGA